MNPKEYLEQALKKATEALAHQEVAFPNADIKSHIDTITQYSESAKGVFTVILTSLVYKLLHPEQDIRRHQTSISGGYSGRTFDSKYITPFLKEHRFPAMAESGWLTRSLEQKQPYDLSYPGAIRPEALRKAFLSSIDHIQHASEDDRQILLSYLLAHLVKQREAYQLDLTIPQHLSIDQLLKLLKRHFEGKYKFEGSSRLPVLAIYAIYKVLTKEIKRFKDHTLLALESHTSADKQSGRMGDVDIVDKQGHPFEAVEVKYNIPISLKMVDTAYDKFRGTKIKRYYILSTASISEEERAEIEKRILDIKHTHGCQVIANGIYTSLLYYLRLLEDPVLFTEAYKNLLEEDRDIKYEHKQAWNKLVEDILR